MRHGNPAGTSHSGASGSLKYGNAVAQTLEERKSATVGPLPGFFFCKVEAVWTWMVCNEDDINPVRMTASAPEAIVYPAHCRRDVLEMVAAAQQTPLHATKILGMMASVLLFPQGQSGAAFPFPIGH